MFFFWYKREEQAAIASELRRIGRNDLIDKLVPGAKYTKKNDKEKKQKSFNPNFTKRKRKK
jgi:hypothetical protein